MISNNQTESQLKHTVEQKTDEYFELESRVAALQVNFAKAEQTFGDFTAAFDAMVARDEESAELKFARRTETLPVPITAAHARYAPGLARSIPSLAVTFADAPWRRSAKAGDVLSVAVEGTWAPTCALSKSNLAEHIASFDDVTVGPEGFIVQQQHADYHVVGTSLSKRRLESHEDSATSRACAGVHASVGGPINAMGVTIGGVSIYASVEQCSAHSHSLSEQYGRSTESSSSAETRATAMFASGMRLPETPFEELPAGSLLLVGVLPGRLDLDAIRVLRVLHAPHTGIPVGEDLDFYLVVNDRNDCGHSNPRGGLHVNVTTLEPAGRSAKALGLAMSRALSRVRAKRDALVAQGELLAGDPVSLRSQAMQDLRNAYGTDPSNHVPASYLEFFWSWVDAELVKIEQLVTIRKLRFAQNQLKTELASYAHDLEVNGTKARLLDLIPQWKLRSLEADKLGEQVNALADVLTYELAPAADLRFPETRERIRSDAALRARIANLMTDMTKKPFLVVAAEFRDIADLIAYHFDASVRASTAAGQNTFRAVVSFPRPDRENVALSSFQKASEPRSRAVWEAADRGEVARFEIRPEDIYSADGGFSIASCAMASPVIKWVSLFVAGVPSMTATTMNQQRWQTAIAAADIGWFPTREGTLAYGIANPLLREGMVRGLFGDGHEAASSYSPGDTDLRALAGISPFTTFSVNLAGLQALSPSTLAQATELMMVFELDAKIAPGGVRGVATCP